MAASIGISDAAMRHLLETDGRWRGGALATFAGAQPWLVAFTCGVGPEPDALVLRPDRVLVTAGAVPAGDPGQRGKH
ncbi:hypothetical protein ACQPWW_09780 [Micromonospora sp. CA-240977]|uniref:hypothetical protein n=1 Tax=Micromonospora sp. CA-240977 TaxID=3239957 RepID=UPI003D94D377